MQLNMEIAVVFLNQRIRPFTAKWHRLSIDGALSDEAECKNFRAELQALQGELKIYTQMLADMAGVEDLTELEDREASLEPEPFAKPSGK
uniref:Uncharacterized protein n=1 Tax=Candidatus Kentrum sp. UNK TaxID=2126344 RepID=A0A451AJ39_9GAMM|nr:MAG: hypothetical protein BECKUNK1418G_GA0071005_107713 [Candidatus Kentron sp. UNK]VFK71700.1 MAG: hypothetical protein BECKUNK1418H_GA0071006_10795 [Candidatus Kentron sp. UNK]